VNYATFGSADGDPVLILNGLSFASWIGVDGFGFVSTMIASDLDLRFIHPERTGYGLTPYNASLTPQQYVDDLAELMTNLGYAHFSVIGASSGGVYADYLAVRHPDRLTSLHLASAVATSGHPWGPVATPSTYLGAFSILASYSPSFPLFLSARDQDTFYSVPGYIDWLSVILHYSLDPESGTDIGMTTDVYSYCAYPLPNAAFADVTAPVFIYHGEVDANVPLSQAYKHADKYPSAPLRLYPNDGHLTSVRHAGQILVDAAGMPGKTVICHDGKTKLVSASSVSTHLAHGDILDICAWKGTLGE
jgi:non-heme chloroperoxidase